MQISEKTIYFEIKKESLREIRKNEIRLQVKQS